MKSHQRGQILVFLLVLILVMVTIVLSLWSRMVQQKKINLRSERSSRVFTAAEAAIEEALRQDLNSLIADSGGTSYSENLTTQLGAQGLEQVSYTAEQVSDFVIDLDRDDVVQADFHPDSGDWLGGDITICWEVTGAGNDPSLEMSFYEEDPVSGEVSVTRYAFNAVLGRGNGFTDPGSADRGMTNLTTPTVTCDGYENEVTGVPTGVDPVNATYFRIKTWYAPSRVRIVGLPDQVLRVTGAARALAGEERTVETETYPATWPPIFDFVLFDGSTNPLRK